MDVFFTEKDLAKEDDADDVFGIGTGISRAGRRMPPNNDGVRVK